MHYGHGVDNRNPRFSRRGCQLDFGESRSLSQIFQQNQRCTIHQLWAYVCVFGPGLMVMIAMAMMVMVCLAMVIVLVMVLIVQEALRQLGWLLQF